MLDSNCANYVVVAITDFNLHCAYQTYNHKAIAAFIVYYKTGTKHRQLIAKIQ